MISAWFLMQCIVENDNLSEVTDIRDSRLQGWVRESDNLWFQYLWNLIWSEKGDVDVRELWRVMCRRAHRRSDSACGRIWNILPKVKLSYIFFYYL